MKILKWDKKIVEEIWKASSPVVCMRVLKDDDKDRCPHCNKPINTEFTFVEDSPIYREKASPVETI